MKFSTAAVAAMLLAAPVRAVADDLNLGDYEVQTDPLMSLRFDARFDGCSTWYGKEGRGDMPGNETGFTGAYLNVQLDGTISPRFNYALRYRINKDNQADHTKFMEAVDWAWLSYKATDKLTLTGGKQVIMVGTMEYDYAPIDIYYASDYWNHCACYQIGATAGYEITRGNTVSAQVCNSPMSEKSLDKLMAYNLFYNGTPAPWLHMLYSANMMEYAHGNFINYIALGHRLSLGQVGLDVDYMNRYGGRGTAFFKDFTISGKLDVNVGDHLTLFAKGGYDQNKAQAADAPFVIDRTVLPGVSRGFYGAGVEYNAFADSRNRVRLFGLWHAETDRPRANTVMVGLRWQMNVLNVRKK